MNIPIDDTTGDSELPAGQCQQKAEPAKGKRYSPAQRREILTYANEHTVKAAADKFGVTETSIYEWRRANKRRGESAVDAEHGKPSSESVEEDAKEVRDRKVLAMWRQHPGYGPSQVRNMLKRDSYKISVGTVRDVMERNGYLPPTLKRKEHVGRYEAD